MKPIYPLWNTVENSSIEGVWILTVLAHQLATLFKIYTPLYNVQVRSTVQGEEFYVEVLISHSVQNSHSPCGRQNVLKSSTGGVCILNGVAQYMTTLICSRFDIKSNF